MPLLLALTSCRETPVELTLTPTQDYRIEGRVTDRYLNPVRNADVVLYYRYDFVSSDSTQVRSWTVPDSAGPVTVAVYDFRGNRVRTLFIGTRPAGDFLAWWDGTDSLGTVRNGVFEIRYMTDDTVRYLYRAAVDGEAAAHTDSVGNFAIDAGQLPIGYAPVPLYSYDSTRFSGYYQIDPVVDIVVRSAAGRAVSSPFLLYGYVNHIDLILQ